MKEYKSCSQKLTNNGFRFEDSLRRYEPAIKKKIKCSSLNCINCNRKPQVRSYNQRITLLISARKHYAKSNQKIPKITKNMTPLKMSHINQFTENCQVKNINHPQSINQNSHLIDNLPNKHQSFLQINIEHFNVQYHPSQKYLVATNHNYISNDLVVKQSTHVIDQLTSNILHYPHQFQHNNNIQQHSSKNIQQNTQQNTQINIQQNIFIKIQTNRQSNIQKNLQIQKQPNGQINQQTNQQANRQANQLTNLLTKISQNIQTKNDNIVRQNELSKQIQQFPIKNNCNQVINNSMNQKQDNRSIHQQKIQIQQDKVILTNKILNNKLFNDNKFIGQQLKSQNLLSNQCSINKSKRRLQWMTMPIHNGHIKIISQNAQCILSVRVVNKLIKKVKIQDIIKLILEKRPYLVTAKDKLVEAIRLNFDIQQ